MIFSGELIFLLFPTFVTIISAQEDLILNYDFENYKVMKRGEPLTLTCDNKLNSEDPKWYKNDRMLFSGKTFNIPVAKESDTGKYVCKIDYTPLGGVAKIEIQKEIDVIVKPQLKMSSKVVDVSEGSQLKLLCQTKAYPLPIIKWEILLDSSKMVTCDPNDEYVDGDICDSIIKVDKTKGRWHLKEYNGVPNSQFVITTTVKADEGNYTCQASNIAGNLRETAQVTIGEKGYGIGPGTIAIIVVTTMVTVAAGIGLFVGWQRKREESQV